MTDNIPSNLVDPINDELYVDPIVVPCCGQAFSRHVLIGWFNTNIERRCPMCNNIDKMKNFDPRDMAKAVHIADQVEAYCLENHIELKTPNIESNKILNAELDSDDSDSSNTASKKEKTNKLKWDASYCSTINLQNQTLSLSNLHIEVSGSNFEAKRNLFLVIADRSGSMSSSKYGYSYDAESMHPSTPWKQVETALLRIDSLQRGTPYVQFEIVGYASTAERIDLTGDEKTVQNTIKKMYTGGGTHFRTAFQKVAEVLKDYKFNDGSKSDPYSIDSIDIVFMTDGQAGDLNKQNLPIEFRDMLRESWAGKVSVHAIGFSDSCDKDLLESFRKSGTEEGTFRYAEADDGDDELCNKITNLFELTSSSFRIPLSLKLENSKFIDTPPDSDHTSKVVQFPIRGDGTGSLDLWIDVFDEPILTISSDNNENNENNEATIVIVSDKTAKNSSELYYQKWVSYQIDLIASELFDLNAQNKQTYSDRLLKLHCDIISEKVEMLSKCGNRNDISQRCGFILEQVDLLRGGSEIDIGRLGDMRYASRFAPSKKTKKVKTSTSGRTIASRPTTQIEAQPYWKETQIFITYKHDGMERNEFQQMVMDRTTNEITPYVRAQLDKISRADVLHTDANGNNTLHLLAYVGQNYILEEVLNMFDIDPNIENDNRDTPIILAIKKYGHHKCVSILFDHGAVIPSERKNGLEQFARSLGFIETADLIYRYGDVSTIITMGTEYEHIRVVYDRAMSNGASIDVSNYLNVSMAKCHIDMVRTLIDNHSAVPNFAQLMAYCIPPLVDDPEADKYVKLANLVLNACPDLINMTDEDKEGPLHRAVTSGNLPSVQFFLDRGADLEARNILGNTPLWLACAKRYPCIIDELLARGADPNAANLKGDTPLYPICQYGPLKSAEALLSHGADVQNINRNGDTLILISCRNGQHEILQTMLTYVDPDFVNRKAEIDGFNAIMASAEQDRGECIRVLHEYGVDLNQKTDSDNPIIQGATPLQIAVFYSREFAVSTLLELGAEPNVQDLNGSTALHMAVIKGDIQIIRMLIGRGSDLGIEDRVGNTPLFYCRDERIRKSLLPKTLISLMSLAQGEFGDEEDKACELLKNASLTIRGCFESSQIIDPHNENGNTPLGMSVIYSRFRVFETLFELGADPFSLSAYNMTPYLWAKWIKNSRVLKMIETSNETSNEQDRIYDRLNEASLATPESRPIMFLGKAPAHIIIPNTSGILKRMESVRYTVSDIDTSSLLKIKGSDNPLVISNLSEILSEPSLIWTTKIRVIENIARETHLNAKDLAMIGIFTNNSILSTQINDSIRSYIRDGIELPSDIQTYITSMYSALDKIQPYQGAEVYVGFNNLIRSDFTQGAEVCLTSFLSASTSWHVAMEGNPNFDSKKKGTIIIIKNATGRYVGEFSQFGIDCEVIFAPPTRFRVNRWYRGDSICLGQANIREHTFGIKDEHIAEYQNSNRALIIELEEIGL